MSARTAILTAGLGQAFTFIPYWLVAFGIGGVNLLWGATIVEGIVSTMATVALFTLMMDASDPEHAGTDYTLLASIYVLVTSAGQFFASVIADLAMSDVDTLAGYRVSFAIGIVLTMLGTLMMVVTLDRRPMPARLARDWQRDVVTATLDPSRSMDR